MDKRKEKTNKIIKDTLIVLAKKHPINQLSVKQVCEEADINRGTFYLHYRSMKVLINKIESEIIENIKDILKSHFKEGRFNYRVAMIMLSDYIKEEKDFIKVMIGKNGDITFIPKITNEIETLFIRSQNIPDDDYLMASVCNFMVGGTLSIYQKWINNDCLDDVYSLISPFGFSFFALYRQSKKFKSMME